MQLQTVFDELRGPKARLNRDKTIRTQSYEAPAAILKQATGIGQREEKQVQRTERPEEAEHAAMTEDQLRAEIVNSPCRGTSRNAPYAEECPRPAVAGMPLGFLPQRQTHQNFYRRMDDRLHRSRAFSDRGR